MAARFIIGAACCWQALLALSFVPAAALDLPFSLSKPAVTGRFPPLFCYTTAPAWAQTSSGAPWRWSSLLTAKGYVTIWPDSFSTRGHPRGVCLDGSPPRILPRQRAADAYAALDHLRTLPYVDHDRIAVMGGSHGGLSTLATIVDIPENLRPDGARFAAAIALYPGCGRSVGGWSVTRSNDRHDVLGYSGVFKPLAPLLILIGELDDWTPPEPCRRLAAAAREAGYPVEIVVYPGAHHSFDGPARLLFLAERRNINSQSGKGATTAGNERAWTDAVTRVETFLAAHLPKPPG